LACNMIVAVCHRSSKTAKIHQSDPGGRGRSHPKGAAVDAV
jgi:hypothetical protein